uniref:Uncharacterized protein n=1 Tax=Oryza glumipatula TaxID=40148 RepID=A0A0E0B129_9ORYZ
MRATSAISSLSSSSTSTSAGVTFALVDDVPGVDELRRVKPGGGELGEYRRVDADPSVVEGKRGMVAVVVALVDGRWVDAVADPLVFEGKRGRVDPFVTLVVALAEPGVLEFRRVDADPSVLEWRRPSLADGPDGVGLLEKRPNASRS